MHVATAGIGPDHTDVLVVGAGYVGSVVARLLAEAGRHVTAVRRSAPTGGEAGAGEVHWVAADVLTAEGLATLPASAAAVVFAMSPGGRDEEAYRRVHVDAPAEVVAHLEHAPSRIVLTTSTAVYGQDDGSLVHEGSPTTPDRATAKVLVEAERRLRGLAPVTTSLRLGGIYGPGRTRLVDQVRAGEAGCAPGQWTNRIHRDDAAAAIVHVLGLDRPPPVANVVDDTPAERCDVIRWLAARLAVPPPADAPEAVGRTRGTAKRVDNALLRSTGWHPVHPSWREGYAAMLDEPSAS